MRCSNLPKFQCCFDNLNEAISVLWYSEAMYFHSIFPNKKEKRNRKLELKKHQCSGFTMIELLVVVTIIAVLAMILYSSLTRQVQRGQDAARKSDFAKLKIAFENYYNDKGCYPLVNVMSQCNSTSALAPYLVKVPCDPVTNKPYAYFVDASCKWYALFTNLTDTTDPSIPLAGCSPNCSVGGSTYNYVVTTIPLLSLLQGIGGSISTPAPSATPVPSSTPVSEYACDPSGVCKYYNNPFQSRCPIWYSTPNCNNACSNPSNRCPGNSGTGGGGSTSTNQQGP